MNLVAAATGFDINAHSEKSAAGHLGIQLGSIGPTWIELTMPCNHRTQDTDGSVSLGALTILAETAGSVAATLSIDRKRYQCVGQTLQVNNLFSPVIGGVRARAEPLFSERERQIWDILIVDETDRHVARAKLTIIVLPMDHGSTAVGTTRD